MPEPTQFYINGQWVDPIAGTPLDVIDPSTEEACATISLGGAADTDAAVAAARAAFPGWAEIPVPDRIAALERLAAAYSARAEDLAQAMSREMGAPIDMARQQQVPSGDWHFEGFLEAARSFEWEYSRGPGSSGERIIHEPIGVCALITPWNWPMNQIVLKVAPALVSGCTMVLKPSEIAPLSALVFAEIVDAADIPPGVFNMLNGDGAGDWLIQDASVTHLYLAAAPPTPTTYCTGKVTTAGCTPSIDTSGTPTLSGPDDFLVLTPVPSA